MAALPFARCFIGEGVGDLVRLRDCMAATTADVNRRHAAMNLGKRDRTRGALFGNVEAEDMSHYDPEKLERANDAEIDTLGERAKHLKQVTLNIQGEVDSHLRLLDQLGSDMDHTRGSVGGTMDRFRKVMDVKSNRSLAYVVGSVIVMFMLLRLIL